MERTRKAMYLTCALALCVAVLFIALFAMGMNTASAESNGLSVGITENENVTTIHIQNAKKVSSARSISLGVQQIDTVVDEYDLEQAMKRKSFDRLTPVFPNQKIKLERKKENKTGKIQGVLDVIAIWQGENALYCNDSKFVREGAMYYHRDPSGPPFGSIPITPRPTNGFGTSYEFTTPSGVATYIVAGNHYICGS